MAEVNGVDDEEKVKGEEEITAPYEEDAEQVQCLSSQIHIPSVMCWHITYSGGDGAASDPPRDRDLS